MLHKLLLLFIIVLLGFTNCKTDDTNDFYCTEIFVYGLSVSLVDSATNAPILNDVEIIATDGDYQETLMKNGMDSFFGAGERQGTYTLTATSANYETYVSDPITVSGDRCHVTPKIVKIPLTAK